jgi:hypothetical protein
MLSFRSPKLKLLLSILLSPTVFSCKQLQFGDKPATAQTASRGCPRTIGIAHPDLGSGACTRNFDHTLTLKTAGISLHYNSNAPANHDYGFGSRWRPSWEMEWREFNVNGVRTYSLVLGDGTNISFMPVATLGATVGNPTWLINQDSRQGSFAVQKLSATLIRVYQDQRNYSELLLADSLTNPVLISPADIAENNDPKLYRIAKTKFANGVVTEFLRSTAPGEGARVKEIRTTSNIVNSIKIDIPAVAYDPRIATIKDALGSDYKLYIQTTKGIYGIVYFQTPPAQSGIRESTSLAYSSSGYLANIATPYDTTSVTYAPGTGSVYSIGESGQLTVFESTVVAGNTFTFTSCEIPTGSADNSCGDKTASKVVETLEFPENSPVPKVIKSIVNGVVTVFERERVGGRISGSGRVSRLLPSDGPEVSYAYATSASDPYYGTTTVYEESSRHSKSVFRYWAPSTGAAPTLVGQLLRMVSRVETTPNGGATQVLTVDRSWSSQRENVTTANGTVIEKEFIDAFGNLVSRFVNGVNVYRADTVESAAPRRLKRDWDHLGHISVREFSTGSSGLNEMASAVVTYDPSGNISKSEFDALGRMISHRDGYTSSENEFDAMGNLIRTETTQKSLGATQAFWTNQVREGSGGAVTKSELIEVLPGTGNFTPVEPLNKTETIYKSGRPMAVQKANSSGMSSVWRRQ